MQDIEDKERYINTGRLIHILSNQMKRRNASEAVGDDGLTTMQKHVLKHILLETMHREVYQKDIEEEFRPEILEHIRDTEKRLIQGIDQEDVKICRKVLVQMIQNLAENKKENKEEDENDE